MYRFTAMAPQKFTAKVINRGQQLVKIKSSNEQDQALRQQLYLEIEAKSKACSNSSFACSIPRLEGYAYCIRHILLDPRAPYKQCAFIYQNGKKCNQAAPKHDTKKFPGLTTFCFKHSRLLQLTKTRNTIGKFKKNETTEGYLRNLTRHLNIDKKKINNTNCNEYVEEEIDVVSSNSKRFVSFNHIHNLDLLITPRKNGKGILDYASDSSDDIRPKLLAVTQRNEFNYSDNESIDSDNEDLLKHAGIYTSQEAITFSKDKLVRLQQLYFGQIERLKHLLKEKRRNYLLALRKEKEKYCNIHDQKKLTHRERLQYEKLKSLNHYHKWNGEESVLYRKFKEKRARAAGIYIHKPQMFPKCSYTEGGVKCVEVAMPCCKYCRKHILEDKKQILFRACNMEKGGIICSEPVPNIFEDSTCVWHIKLPTLRTYNQKKYESDTDDEEEEIPVKNNEKRKNVKVEPKKKPDKNKIKVQSNNLPNKTPEETGPVVNDDQNITICHDTINNYEVLAVFDVPMNDGDEFIDNDQSVENIKHKEKKTDISVANEKETNKV